MQRSRTKKLLDNSKTRALQLLALLAAAVLLSAALPSLDKIAAEDGTDRSVKPGDDFYSYANAGWLRTVSIPAGQSAYDNRAMMAEKTSQRVRDLIQNAAASHAPAGSIVQKVGDYYASVKDEDGIAAKKLTPLSAEMARISAIADKQSLSAYLGTTLNS